MEGVSFQCHTKYEKASDSSSYQTRRALNSRSTRASLPPPSKMAGEARTTQRGCETITWRSAGTIAIATLGRDGRAVKSF